MDNPFQILDQKITSLEAILIEIRGVVKPPEVVEPIKYLTREDVANLLQINVSSVFNWTKKGTLKSYQLEGRIYYKLHEIEEAMTSLQK
ncbi:helix-turn-helix domain-containing protein [Cellulophaga sp. L1A9]|uniref:helix-turn-helix domain-containing protein n=1 Tax=Cellulophaga sp. L1A9 TaxID=2686362 RepID=UPI00131ECF92|nr:helix-turn-helix domain-containing protein [Cellulophaga sp. L1A9]